MTQSYLLSLHRSEEAYKKILTLSPSFPRSGEVHLRLGVLLKKRRSYDEAIFHFNRALNKTDPQLDKYLGTYGITALDNWSYLPPSNSSPPTVQFHSAHILQLKGESTEARSKYEVLLTCRTLSPHVKALTQKQLGMYLDEILGRVQ